MPDHTPPGARRAASRDGGYSLLETILALALLTAGATALLQLYTHSLQSGHDTALAMRANDAAVELLARARLYSRAPPGTWSREWHAGGCREVADDGGGPGEEWEAWLATLGCHLPEARARVVDDGDRFAVHLEWRGRTGKGESVLESRR